MQVNIKFIEDDGAVANVSAEVGKTILDVVNENGIYLDCICQGCLACSTCHVVLDKDYFQKTVKESPISEEEKDLIFMADGSTKTSRLGCQIKLTPEMEGMVLRIPPRKD